MIHGSEGQKQDQKQFPSMKALTEHYAPRSTP